MSFDPNDPRITAFVLGELDKQQQAAFQTEMEASDDLRHAVEETHRTLETLTNELRDEPALGLSDAQRDVVEREIDNTQPTRPDAEVASARTGRRPARRRLRFVVGTVAAALIVACGVGSWWYGLDLQNQSPTREGIRGSRFLASTDEGTRQARRSFVAATDFTNGSRAEQTLSDSIAQTTRSDVLATRVYPVDELVLTQPTEEEQEPQATTVAALVRSANKPTSGERAAATVGGRNLQQIHVTPDGATDPGQRPSSDFVALNETSRKKLWKGRTSEGLSLIPALTERDSEVTDAPDHGIGPGYRGDQYSPIVENPFQEVKNEPLSTFSIDVDTASYAKVRMYLMQHGVMPRPDAVRIEELVNYFTYDYEPPESDVPFATRVEIAGCPWHTGHRLARIGIKGKEIDRENRPASNLVFLLDVSGSMNRPNKLPLLKRGMKMLVDQLSENDGVAIVVYAGAAGLVLPPTTGDHKQVILDSLDRLHAGGSTNGGQGIRLAYQTALDNFIQGGVNRVILCTDGDFNVGTTGTDELVRLAEENGKTGVFLSVLGFGMGNHNDAMLEQLSNKGNGNYAFIDTDAEARKVLVQQMTGTLVTIAKDVKIQIEFNPTEVAAYRLIGYENRMLAAEDFNNDKIDAGEIGAGHTVTALYEIIPSGVTTDVSTAPVDDLRYQKRTKPSQEARSGELLTLKLRYKQPDGDTSKKLTFPIKDDGKAFGQASKDFRFTAAVASFGMLLRGSQYKGNATYAGVLETATEAAIGDQSGYRQEFLAMVARAQEISGQ